MLEFLSAEKSYIWLQLTVLFHIYGTQLHYCCYFFSLYMVVITHLSYICLYLLLTVLNAYEAICLYHNTCFLWVLFSCQLLNEYYFPVLFSWLYAYKNYELWIWSYRGLSFLCCKILYFLAVEHKNLTNRLLIFFRVKILVWNKHGDSSLYS